MFKCWAVLVLIGLFALSAAVDTVAKRELHGQRVYLRQWSDVDALQFAESLTEDDDVAHYKRSTPTDATPDVMALSIHSETGRHMHGMLLQRNREIEHPVLVTDDDGMESVPLLAEGEAHYYDTMSDAVVSVRHLSGTKQFDGSFHLDGDNYEVHPMEDDEDDGFRARGFEDHHPHMIMKAPIHSYDNDFKVFEDMEPPKMNLTVAYAPTAMNDTETRGNPAYSVEMAVVVDFGEYYKWKIKEKSAAKAVAALKYKFSYFYNGLSKIYSSVRSGLTIKPYLKRLHICKSKRKSFVYQHDPKLTPKNGKKNNLNSGNILNYVTNTWGPTNGFTIPAKYDHVMYWLGYSLAGSTIGYAWVGTVCRSYATSVIEDGGFESFRTAAHELGHGLGSSHDTSSGDCASSKKHIMAPMETLPDAAHNADGWSFSSCSISAFKTTLAKTSCLSNSGKQANIPKVNPLPGKKFNTKWQCSWANRDDANYGRSVQACSGKTVKESECYNGLMCKKTNGWCSWSGAIRPADGTPCGTGGKQCIKGRCV